MERTHELVSEIRDLINAHRRHHKLWQDPRLFSQLCSALDVIEDTDAAIDTYVESEREEKSVGRHYLEIYGLLQAMVVQQDAVEHVAEALGVSYERDTELVRIRGVRNDAIGHPSRREVRHDAIRRPSRRERLLAFNHIAQHSISWRGFELLTFGPGRENDSRTIDLISLIELQRKLLLTDLERIKEAETRLEMEHRRRFRSEKLADVLPPSHDYMLGKLEEEIAGERPLGVGPWVVAQLQESITTLECRFTKREELPALQDVFDHDAKPAKHALERLGEFFSGGGGSRDDAAAFAFRLKHAIGGLRELAREIDETYDKEPTRLP